MSTCLVCNCELEEDFMELCEECFTEHEQWCQLCGKVITYDEYLEAESFYCKHCNFILKAIHRYTNRA
jgi:hypothetical protein